MDAITNWNAIQCTIIKRGWNAISDVFGTGCRFNTRIEAYHIYFTQLYFILHKGSEFVNQIRQFPGQAYNVCAR